MHECSSHSLARVSASIALLSFTLIAAAAPLRSQSTGRIATTLLVLSDGNASLPRSPDRRARRDSTVVELDSDGLDLRSVANPRFHRRGTPLVGGCGASLWGRGYVSSA